MSSHGTEIDEQSTADNTPEDVAVLYSWANLQGAKYRDYSASRREYRAQVRYRAAKALLERELKAQQEAEAAADLAERAALLPNDAQRGSGDGTFVSHTAVAERVEAARRAEAAAHAAVQALREEREIAEAHLSARRQALVYEESEQRRRQLAGPQPRIPPGNTPLIGVPPPDRGKETGAAGLQEGLQSRLQELTLAGIPTPELVPRAAREDTWAEAEAGGPTGPASEAWEGGKGFKMEPAGPAWLYASQTPPWVRVPHPAAPFSREEITAADTLQDSRERVAARWFALKGVFEHAGPELPAMHPARARDGQAGLLAVFSLAGGVGKTSLVATLGRALSALGESVVLSDTTSHGLLPIYFGLREVRAGVVCRFSPPSEGANRPISLVIYDLEAKGDSQRGQEALTQEILRDAQGSQRLLLDLSWRANWLVRRMADLHPVVVVPMAPDMNSVVSLQTVERMFRSLTDSDGRTVLPFYLLNQFDATLPLHLDVREVLRRQLGDRLLRVAIRRSPAVSEALAEGMTVVDYAPDAPVTHDYLEVASWLRSVSPPATVEGSGALRGRR